MIMNSAKAKRCRVSSKQFTIHKTNKTKHAHGNNNHSLLLTGRNWNFDYYFKYYLVGKALCVFIVLTQNNTNVVVDILKASTQTIKTDTRWGLCQKT